MIRKIVFASAIAFAVPAVAQEAPADPAQPATEAQAAPQQAAPQQAAPSADGAQQPASGQAQVAQVVETDFPSFDKDSNGELSEAEFSDWMLKLRQASGDKTAPTELKSWASAAFAQADKDKSKAVSKVELTTFLAG